MATDLVEQEVLHDDTDKPEVTLGGELPEVKAESVEDVKDEQELADGNTLSNCLPTVKKLLTCSVNAKRPMLLFAISRMAISRSVNDVVRWQSCLCQKRMSERKKSPKLFVGKRIPS
mgnify:CR=1 FL=1